MNEYILPKHIIKEDGLYLDTKSGKFLKNTELKDIQCSHLLKLSKPAKRQLRYIQLLMQDKTNLEIAEIMKVSTRTVDTYRDGLLKKFGVRSRVGIILFALKNSFVSL